MLRMLLRRCGMRRRRRGVLGSAVGAEEHLKEGTDTILEFMKFLQSLNSKCHGVLYFTLSFCLPSNNIISIIWLPSHPPQSPPSLSIINMHPCVNAAP